MRIKERSFCLRRGRCAWCDLREDRTRGCNNFFLRRQNSNRLENRNAQGSFSLDGGLVAQMAIRTMRVIRGIGMMPVADDAGGKYQKGNQRQRNPEYANRLAHSHCWWNCTLAQLPGNSNAMWDVRKPLPVTRPPNGNGSAESVQPLRTSSQPALDRRRRSPFVLCFDFLLRCSCCLKLSGATTVNNQEQQEH